jgi:MFS family permease
MKRANMVVLAGAVSMLGWGTVLPYQYAYAADTRGWGTLAAVGASSLFSIGALLASPVGGRLADRLPPVRVAAVAKAVAALASVGLLLAGSPTTFLAAMCLFGMGITAAQPVQSVLVLRWVGSADRRRVFAWQFTGSSVGMALGALLAAQVVDLDDEHGMWPSFVMAAVGFLLSAGLLALAGRGPVTSQGLATSASARSQPRVPAPSLPCEPWPRSPPCAGSPPSRSPSPSGSTRSSSRGCRPSP